MPYRGKMTWAGSTQHDFLTPSLAEEEEMYHLISACKDRVYMLQLRRRKDILRQSFEFLSNKVISTNSDFTHMELQKGKVCNLIKRSLGFSNDFSVGEYSRNQSRRRILSLFQHEDTML